MSGVVEQLDSRVVNGANGLSFINVIDGKLRVVSQLQLATRVGQAIQLRLSLFYDNDPMGVMSFDLHQYSPSEGVALARDIASNQFIMREIDEYLCGDMVE